jgi:hypothetical protein
VYGFCAAVGGVGVWAMSGAVISDAAMTNEGRTITESLQEGTTTPGESGCPARRSARW